MTGPAPRPDMVLVGRVVRVHGLRGQVVVNPETDFPESRFQPGAVVYRVRAGAAEPMRVTSLRLHRGRPIVGFEGIESIEQAEPLPANTFYVHDLVGCRVETRSGQMVGSVARVEGAGGASLLAVETGDGEVLVPLVADICVAIDIARKWIAIEPPEGLIEVNRVRPRPEHRRSHKGESRG